MTGPVLKGHVVIYILSSSVGACFGPEAHAFRARRLVNQRKALQLDM